MPATESYTLFLIFLWKKLESCGFYRQLFERNNGSARPLQHEREKHPEELKYSPQWALNSLFEFEASKNMDHSVLNFVA